MISPFQSPQTATQAPGYLGFHPKPYSNVGFGDPIAVLTDRSKRNTHDSILLLDLRHQVDVKGVGAIVKNNEPFAVMFDLADCTDHSEAPFSTVRNV